MTQPLELEVERLPEDPVELWEDVAGAHWPGLTGAPRIEGGRIILPRVHELRVDGRPLRADEHGRAVELLLTLAGAYRSRCVHWWVEEVFTLEWEAMDESTIRRVRELLAELPGSRSGLSSTRWFGAEDGPAPWLGGSMGPPGQQIFGVLPRALYTDWRALFLRTTAEFPYREV